MESVTYRNCRILIENDRYKKEDMMAKIDVFLLADRIIKEEYIELKTLIDSKDIKS